MTQSILLTIKKMLGIAEEYHAFDLDIITHINSVFLFLYQFGIGPETPYQITDEDQTWSEFQTDIPGIPTYIYLRVRLLFDPPTNSFLVDSMKEQIKEFEWRFDMQHEHGPEPPREPTPEEVGATLYSMIQPRGGRRVDHSDG